MAELNKLMADEVVIDMVLDNLVVGNSNIANHGVVSVCVKPVSCLEDCQGTAEISTILFMMSITFCKLSKMTFRGRSGVKMKYQEQQNPGVWYAM